MRAMRMEMEVRAVRTKVRAVRIVEKIMRVGMSCLHINLMTVVRVKT